MTFTNKNINMKKYSLTNKVFIEAVTFDELVEYGKNTMEEKDLVDGMPWSFDFEGTPVTHENDECYIVMSASGTNGQANFTPNDMLIVHTESVLDVISIEEFNTMYAEMKDTVKGESVEKLRENYPGLVDEYSLLSKEDLLNQICAEVLDLHKMDERVQTFMNECTSGLSKTNYTPEAIKGMIHSRQVDDLNEFCSDLIEMDTEAIMKDIHERAADLDK